MTPDLSKTDAIEASVFGAFAGAAAALLLFYLKFGVEEFLYYQEAAFSLQNFLRNIPFLLEVGIYILGLYFGSIFAFDISFERYRIGKHFLFPGPLILLGIGGAFLILPIGELLIQNPDLNQYWTFLSWQAVIPGILILLVGSFLSLSEADYSKAAIRNLCIVWVLFVTVLAAYLLVKLFVLEDRLG